MPSDCQQSCSNFVLRMADIKHTKKCCLHLRAGPAKRPLLSLTSDGGRVSNSHPAATPATAMPPTKEKTKKQKKNYPKRTSDTRPSHGPCSLPSRNPSKISNPAWKMSTTDVAAKPTLASKCKRRPPIQILTNTHTHTRPFWDWKAARMPGRRQNTRLPSCPTGMPHQVMPRHPMPQLEHSRKFQFFSHHCSLLCLRSPSVGCLCHIAAQPATNKSVKELF